MRLTTKGRYAVTAMLDLAMHCEQRPVSLADISLRQGISQSYLEQLFAKLKKAGLIRSLRGPGGGYTLANPPDTITISTIILAVGEGVDATRCGGSGDCQEGAVCLTHELWSDLSNRIDAFLGEITLTSVISRRGVVRIAARQDAAARKQHEHSDIAGVGEVESEQRISAREVS